MSDEINGGSPEDAKAANVQYVFHVTKAIRGREANTRAKLESEGWEFVTQTTGTLRTEMSFRKVKPKSPLAGAWTAFRALTPKTQRISLATAGGMIVALVVGIGALASQGGDDPEPPQTATDDATATQSHAPSEEPSEGPTETPTADSSETTAADESLTADNNAELAAVLKADYCAPAVAKFAKEYVGRTLELDGSIVNMANHGSYDTRYDILIGPGDKGPNTTIGPLFKYEDVNVFDLNLTGENIPNTLGEGDLFHFVAEVDYYGPNGTCLFFLNPVSTQAR